MSQLRRLKELLSDNKWHRTDEIARVVYATPEGAVTVSRIGARIFDLKKKFNAQVDSKPDHEQPSLWLYRMLPPNGQRDFAL